MVDLRDVRTMRARLILADVLDWLVRVVAPEVCELCRQEEHRHDSRTGQCVSVGCECCGPLL